MKQSVYIFLVILSLVYLVSCEDEKYTTSTDARLVFSVDTVMFDTIFTTVGSTTQHLKVYNPYDQSVKVSAVRLAGSPDSDFRLNINGIPSDELVDLEIPANDSIYIFVEVTIDPQGENQPIVVKDSIEFLTNTNLQYVRLVAWGQDIELVNTPITVDTEWTGARPYVVYENALVEKNATLKVGPGARIYFHAGTGLYVKGKLQVNGTLEKPVVFQADRLEEVYRDVPDQWNGIFLYSGSHDNLICDAEIKNANIGLQVGNIENEGYASVDIRNSRIYNHSYAGIFALKSKISAYNTLIYNCGYYAAALLIGGEYEFYHTTIANYWGGYTGRIRSTSSLMISDHVVVDQGDGSSTTYSGDLRKAYFANSIITGNILTGNEVELARLGKQEFNYFFDHCLLSLADTVNVENPTHYSGILKNALPKFVDPYVKMNFELDTLSAAKDAGSPEIGKLFPFDLVNQNRTLDAGPDLGAYERVEEQAY
ncbi:hypothetical protein [Mangrovibacterium marinum]|uniref:Parallel beta helix pectate lyase-like protein n=1 Tax=Mangrovibacterium marinum TaxID=1639118 RepID=A0A2T5C1J2_9BACT|nr:hypothetical protein [Mangrovibacterium marinum]PTN08521.1 hypothetical protein C8N47_10878 [Mangrovibacterium marinum]